MSFVRWLAALVLALTLIRSTLARPEVPALARSWLPTNDPLSLAVGIRRTATGL
jgi:hypothetical protein